MITKDIQSVYIRPGDTMAKVLMSMFLSRVISLIESVRTVTESKLFLLTTETKTSTRNVTHLHV